MARWPERNVTFRGDYLLGPASRCPRARGEVAAFGDLFLVVPQSARSSAHPRSRPELGREGSHRLGAPSVGNAFSPKRPALGALGFPGKGGPPTMLHRRRKRLEEMARQEAAGANFWTDEFDEATRTKILHAFTDAVGDYELPTYASYARGLILRDEGWMRLTNQDTNSTYDFLNFLAVCEDDMVPTVVEAMFEAVAKAAVGGFGQWEAQRRLSSVIAVILREHRISYDLIDGQMVEFSSREMHEAVMVPALSLLAGRADLDKAESAYRDALDEISKGKAGDAITDAGTALQETLVVLGCSGNALGPLIKSAKSQGLLAAHDTPLLDAIERTMQWVSADRSETGDAHQAADATVDDAWFIGHIVGALMLRLAHGGPRGARAS